MCRDSVGVAIGLTGVCVVFVESAHAVNFIMNTAGDVLQVLHVGPEGGRERERESE